MKIFSVPAPGSEIGPCINPCVHNLCVMMRHTSHRRCYLCHKPIGYEQRYRYNGATISHTACGAKHYKNLAVAAARSKSSAAC